MEFPSETPLSPQQRASLRGFDVNREQALWLAGFFAGIANAAPQNAAPEALASSAELTILYGTESGNAEALAERTRGAAQRKGLKPTVVNMADVKVEQLKNWKNLLVIVSTWGEGDPPDAAAPFYNALLNGNAPKLDDCRFSVLALGDTSYEHFCRTGKEVDRRLVELGAARLVPRVDCDVDFESPYEDWAQKVIAALSELGPATFVDAPATVVTPPAPAVEYGKKNPFPAPLKDRILLNGRDSSKQTYHLEIGLEGSGYSYLPGDALAVVPTNSPRDVDAIIGATGFAPDTLVDDGQGTQVTLYEALLHRYDITTASSSFLRKYNELAENADLAQVLAPDQKEWLRDYLWGRQIVDFMESFRPKRAIDPAAFVKILRKMPPRLYSIASSLKAHPGEVHLTVGAVRYSSHGRERTGVASTYVADRVAVGETLPVFMHVNKLFRLPVDPSVPIIMVGPGTGIAPFRAFLEERQAIGAQGKNWLFFGDQHFLTDFLYQTELQSYLKDGLLTRLSLAFSRDQKKKVYVQHRMHEAGREIFEWLEEGAYFYVCGDAARMAGDVHEELIRIVETHGARSREDAEAYILNLKKAKRYLRDVY